MQSISGSDKLDALAFAGFGDVRQGQFLGTGPGPTGMEVDISDDAHGHRLPSADSGRKLYKNAAYEAAFDVKLFLFEILDGFHNFAVGFELLHEHELSFVYLHHILWAMDLVTELEERHVILRLAVRILLDVIDIVHDQALIILLADGPEIGLAIGQEDGIIAAARRRPRPARQTGGREISENQDDERQDEEEQYRQDRFLFEGFKHGHSIAVNHRLPRRHLFRSAPTITRKSALLAFSPSGMATTAAPLVTDSKLLSVCGRALSVSFTIMVFA